MRPQATLGPPSLPSKVIVFYLQIKEKAERVGFEPTRRLNTAYAISSRAPSANSDTSPYMRSLSNGGEDEESPSQTHPSARATLYRVFGGSGSGTICLTPQRP